MDGWFRFFSLRIDSMVSFTKKLGNTTRLFQETFISGTGQEKAEKGAGDWDRFWQTFIIHNFIQDNTFNLQYGGIWLNCFVVLFSWASS